MFLFAGKFQPKKHPDHVITAFKALLEQRSDIHLVMLGDGELRDSLKHFADGASSAITFTGFVNQSEIAAYYAAADCLVLPSDSGETWGLVVNEALASGTPAIVSDRVGCQPDLVIEERNRVLLLFWGPDAIDAEDVVDVRGRRQASGNGKERYQQKSVNILRRWPVRVYYKPCIP